ncbi:MAG: heavy metal-associated domain-containing protein [Planctomycetota bacterium]
MNTIALLLISIGAAVTAEAPADPADAIKSRKLPQGTIELHVADLHCKTCARKLARSLYKTPGVQKVRTYVSKDLAIIVLQPKKEVQLARLWLAAEAAQQKPLAILVMDKKLVAKDLADAIAELAKAPSEGTRR